LSIYAVWGSPKNRVNISHDAGIVTGKRLIIIPQYKWKYG
jgi:hypothetical protein